MKNYLNRYRDISLSLKLLYPDIYDKLNNSINKADRMNTNKLKLAIVSAVWKRPEVFEMFAKGVRFLIDNCQSIDFYVIIAGSEGERTKNMVERQGFRYVEMPNDPLATKVNAPILIAKELGVDYVIGVGSDDIITPELMNIYEFYMRQSVDYIGVLDFYFYDTVSKKSIYWGGYREEYRRGEACGAGRVISKRLLNLWNWAPWEVKDSKGLDGSIQRKLKTTTHTKATFLMKDYGVFALDIKSSTNMTPFSLWDNSVFIDSGIIKKEFNYIF